jgi:beta-glucosidase
MGGAAVAVAATVAALLVALPGAGASRAASSTPIYQDPSYSFAERAADLVSRMTLAEKASQMNSSYSPAIPRLGVPQWGWWNEALHGVSREQLLNNANATTLINTTSYPDDQSLGSTWDPNLIYQVASAISDEAREVVTNNTENLDFYSPTMNLERDPRWGRTGETYGEDPYLVSQEVSQFVDGLQGEDQGGKLLPEADGYLKAIATIKHYAANNSEVNRLTGSSDMDQRTLLEYYTKTFRDIVQQANPGSVMSAYNEVNGTPSPADNYLNDTLLRQTFGFGGYLTSDCDAIYEITNGHHWQPQGYPRPVNNTERHAFAMAAGEDLNCQTGYHDSFNYGNSLPTASMQGIPTTSDTFNVNDIDTSLVRLFTARMETGEFDDPTKVPWVAQARAAVPQGTWTNSNANNAVTETPARLALARQAADESIVLLKNATSNANGTTGQLLPLQVPSSGPYKVAVVGYFAHPSSLYLGDYASSQGTAGQANNVDSYTGIKNAIQAIDPSATVDFYRGFTGTSTTTPNCCTTIDSSAISAIQSGGYNAVVVVVGTDGSSASASCVGCGTEASDRTAITLPGNQASLINQVAAANPNTIVYMRTLGPMDVSSFEPNVSAILWSSYNAQREGQALADVLLGAYDPSARLSATWFKSLAQIPEPITDYSIRPNGINPGRTYMYYDGSLGNEQYPFGYGLSYTTFSFSNLNIDNTNLDANDSFHVSADVTNTGSVAGREVVQLYVSEPDAPASLERPIKRLEGFQLVSLDPGQTKTVDFTIKVPDLAFFDQSAGKWAVDDGRYEIRVGSSSADSDLPLSGSVDVSGTLTPTLSVLTAKPVMQGDPARDIQQRVMFPEGVTVLPQLTASMSDDTLYGYISKGSSKPFPSGMTFSYSSDRPDVVSVAPDGTITTVSNGVATITATATYDGISRSTSFVVRVLSELNGIRINGVPLPGFQPDTFNYDFIVPDLATGVPQVTATTPDAAASVSVTQAGAVPGTATIAVTGPDGITLTYRVHFAYPGVSDEFNSSTLGSQWTFVRQNPATESLTTNPGSLTITAEQGDLNTTTNTARNILVQPALGDWTIESKLTFNVAPHVNNQQGGIIAYGDDDNYLKVDWEYTSGQPRIVETVEDNLSGVSNPTPIAQVLASIPTAGILGTGPNTTVWFRMTKTGPRYSSFYSTDGSTWTPIYTTGASLTDAKVGLFAYNRAGTSTDMQVAFDYFHVSNPIPVSFQNLEVIVALFSTNPDVTSGLNDKLEAAASAPNQTARDNQLSAFEHQVRAQSGKALTPDQAQFLIQFAQALM